MAGIFLPQIVAEQSIELRGNETHLRSQLHSLLAGIKKILGQFALEEHHRFGAQRAVLGPAE